MTDASSYAPPKVWKWDAESGGRFAGINRPTAGSTHEKDLPVGTHPLQLYSLATPNGVKVTVLLEELLALGKQGAEYDAYLINILEGDQFGSGLRRGQSELEDPGPGRSQHLTPDAVRRGQRVNKAWGPEAERVPERHAASDLD